MRNSNSFRCGLVVQPVESTGNKIQRFESQFFVTYKMKQGMMDESAGQKEHCNVEREAK